MDTDFFNYGVSRGIAYSYNNCEKTVEPKEIGEDIEWISSLPDDTVILSMSFYEHSMAPESNSMHLKISVLSEYFEGKEVDNSIFDGYNDQLLYSIIDRVSKEDDRTILTFRYACGRAHPSPYLLQESIKLEGRRTISRKEWTAMLIFFGTGVTAIIILLPYKKILRKVRIIKKEKCN